MDVKRYDTNSSLMFRNIGRNQENFQMDEICFDWRVKNSVAMDMPKK